jgi:UDP-glucose 6-dehydrogenase
MKITIVGAVGVGLVVEYMDVSGQPTENADSLTVVTEWRQFKQSGFCVLNNEMGSKKTFDGLNIYHPQLCIDYGLSDAGIDRNSGLYV